MQLLGNSIKAKSDLPRSHGEGNRGKVEETGSRA